MQNRPDRSPDILSDFDRQTLIDALAEKVLRHGEAVRDAHLRGAADEKSQEATEARRLDEMRRALRSGTRAADIDGVLEYCQELAASSHPAARVGGRVADIIAQQRRAKT